jgi:hypothetical protein
MKAEPGEILPYPLRESLRGALGIGVVQPEDEAPAMLPRPQPIVKRGPDVADVEAPCRRRREAGDDVHRQGL